MSKFTEAMKAAKGRTVSPVKPIEAIEQEPERAEQPKTVRSKRGRPATGKRSEVGVVQVSAYMDRDTHLQAKIKLLEIAQRTGKKQDFSGLIQELVSQWLRRH